MNKSNMELLEMYEYVLRMNKTPENTVINYINDVKGFVEYLGEKSVLDITVIDADKYLNSLQGKKQATIKQATRNRKISSFKLFYAYLIRNNKMSHDPLVDLKVIDAEDDTEEKETLEINELKRLCKVLIQNAKHPESQKGCSDRNAKINALRDKALFLTIFHTGARMGELLNLELDEIIQLEDGNYVLYIPKHKNKNRKKDKYIPIDSEFIKFIKEYRESIYFTPNNNYVFLSQNGEKLDTGNTNKRLKRYIEEAGIDKKITNHCGRHTFATLAATEMGMQNNELATILGHTTTKMVDKTYFNKNNKATMGKHMKLFV